MRLIATALVLLLSAACQQEATPATAPGSGDGADAKPWADDPAARRIEADLRYLADDRMEGRETGTPGYELASGYLARRYDELGLQPAGDSETYFQHVPLLKATLLADGAQFVVKRGGRVIPLAFEKEFLPSSNFNTPEFLVEAPAVFVGQAVHAPELDHDDFAGLDLAGKIAVVFGGAPERFDNDRRAFHSSSREKLRNLVERGAIGVVFVNTAEEEARSPWARGAANWARPTMRLRDDDGTAIDSFPQLRGAARVSAAAADALFVGGDQSSAQLFDAAAAGKLKGFDLPGTVLISGKSKLEQIESRNVVGRIPGSDPDLRAEHVVYTAHLDHLGIGKPVKDDRGQDDRIYNGAFDNALGVAIMLEAAHQLQQAAAKPRRSMLFVALTAEEKGLLGSTWFAQRPTVPKDSLVANINMDMPVMTAPSTDVVPIGIEHSSLQGVVEAAAKEVGVALSPDPFPEEVVFVRSDQYSFVRAGIPAVYLDGGVVPADKQRKPKVALTYFLRNCYHQPCDDADQPIHYGDAARLARLNARIGQLVGDADQRPTWNKGDFFGERFGRAPAAGPNPPTAAAPE
ncbi:M28 family metallopeptidase [Luteimonas vadosa]|uniref:M20/M25/M40 family metallo-hydrolase n=1 Tax=Luteimonas vadosa TaxID=1165507 RepID=A0ABP9DQS3_9GAMM